MRFKRTERYERLRWTPRKETFALNRPLREAKRLRKALPLLADQIDAEGEVDVEQEQRARQAQLDRNERDQRAFTARVWREARADYFGSAPKVQVAIRAHWAGWTGPLTCLYFRYVVDVHTGAIEARDEAARERDAALLAMALRDLGAQGELELVQPQACENDAVQ